MALTRGVNFALKIALITTNDLSISHVLAWLMNCFLSSSFCIPYFVINSFRGYVIAFAFRGSVGGFCYFCLNFAIQGPSVGNLLHCLRALPWEFVMTLITIVQRPLAGNLLRWIDYITSVTHLFCIC